MSRKAVAVIGGGYGDEGKGLMTDYWVRKLNDPYVIRINGGCQAGHTVETITGKRHVFSHFGAGTFAGAPTYLSRFFVVNPRLFRQEHEEFVAKFGIEPEIYIDPDCQVTTPIDMIINQWLETSRGFERHGSCGIGFGETLERVKQIGDAYFTMDYVSLMSREQLKDAIAQIVKHYAPRRIEVDDTMRSIFENPQLVDDFYDDIQYLLSNALISMPDLYFKDIVFEGAQGLELDQDYGYFPYVTRSNCGMRNVRTLMEDYIWHNVTDLKVNYVSRVYKTRHGRGPLPNESEMPFPYEDTTNVHNEWQEGLRWAPFNYERYRSITDKDFALYGGNCFGSFNVERIDTMTHVDQIMPCPEVILNTRTHGFQYLSFGPTHKDVYAKAEWAGG